MSRAIHKMRGGDAKIISITQTDFDSDTSINPWAYTVSVGSVPEGGNRRFIFILAHITDAGGVDNDTPDINSVAATLAVKLSSLSRAHLWIGYREINTGTTVTVDFSAVGFADESGVGVYSVITGPAGLSVEDTDTDGTVNYNMHIEGSRNGAILAGSTLRGAASHSWGGDAGVSEGYDSFIGGGRYSAASALITATGTKEVTCNFSSVNNPTGACCSLKYGT